MLASTLHIMHVLRTTRTLAHALRTHAHTHTCTHTRKRFDKTGKDTRFNHTDRHTTTPIPQTRSMQAHNKESIWSVQWRDLIIIPLENTDRKSRLMIWRICKKLFIMQRQRWTHLWQNCAALEVEGEERVDNLTLCNKLFPQFAWVHVHHYELQSGSVTENYSDKTSVDCIYCEL